ncbi:MAG: MSHA pilin protein MshD [Candidatus Azotimanducaceae bacterium]|jgi:MSHA pilin protein MshD
MPVLASNFLRRKSLITCKGATLVELIMAIVIMAVALVSLALTISLSAGKSADVFWQVKVVELGQAYMEEILARRFDEATPLGGAPACEPGGTACSSIGVDAGESRALFDDVDDYDGVDDSPPQNAEGVDRLNYVGYRVQVSVAYADAAQQTAYGLDGAYDAKLVTVTVSHPTGSALVFSAYKGNY